MTRQLLDPAAPQVVKLQRLNARGNLRAFADVELPGGITVHGCRVIQQTGQRPYVALPQIETGEGRFFPVVTGPAELRETIQSAVLAAWTGNNPEQKTP